MGTPFRRSATTFPVLFRSADGPSVAGSLTVAAAGLTLDGGTAAERSHVQIGFGELREVRVARAPSERMSGHVVLVLELVHGPALSVAPLGHGLLHEIADLVAGFTAEAATARERVAVVVPLVDGAEDRVRELIAQGPPLDPSELGLQAHEVWLRGRDAVFVFVGADVRRKVEEAARSPAVWRAGLAWGRCIAGRPALTEPGVMPNDGELLYSWRRAD